MLVWDKKKKIQENIISHRVIILNVSLNGQFLSINGDYSGQGGKNEKNKNKFKNNNSKDRPVLMSLCYGILRTVLGRRGEREAGGW